MKEKNQNIEVLRAISCIMVIVIHVTNYYNRAYGEISAGEYIFSVICNALSRVSVPCFFMISGALLLHRQDTIRQSIKRAFRVLIVLLVWSICYYFFNVYYMGTPVALSQLFIVPAEAHLWYLYTLIPIYLLLPLAQWICGKMKPWMEKTVLYSWAGIAIISTAVTVFGKLEGIDIQLIVGANSWFYLFAGHLIMKHKEKIVGKAKAWFLIYLGSCLINALLTCAFSFATNQHETLLFMYRTAFIMVAAISLYVCVIKSKAVWQKHYISTFCACSFGIYLIHIMFLDVFKKYVEPQEMSAYFAIPILTIGIGLVAWGSIWILRRWKLGKRIS